MDMYFYNDLDNTIEREQRIKKSGIRDVFTPHTPINNFQLLKGRSKEFNILFEQLNTPGLHALLYGERGIGKSSLANVVANELVKVSKRKLFIKRCSADDNFATIVEQLLNERNVSIHDIQRSKSNSSAINIKQLSVGISETVVEAGSSTMLTSSWVANIIADIDGLLLIDEFDAIKDNLVKNKIAELLKLLSDKNSKVKVLIVGVAGTSSELTAGHPSITRCLREIKLNRMKVVELSKIITDGSVLAKLEFTKQAISRIVFVSSGYPYFTHLLALKAAEEAIANETSLITFKNVIFATQSAVQDAEGSLKNCYDQSINFSNKEEYERILLAASRCREEGFSTQQLKDAYSIISKDSIQGAKLSGYLNKIVSSDGSKILRRLCKGYFRFSDPRMPSFIKIARAYFDE